jgi:hypothetical protein
MKIEKHKSLLILIILSLIYANQAVAQLEMNDFPGIRDKLEKIESQKIAFLTNKLRLTPQESEKFWPVYNEYEDKRKELQKEFEKNNPERLDFIFLSDKEALQIADNRLIFAQKQLDLQKEFHQKIKEILSPKKVLMYYEANNEFRRILLRKLKK